MFLFLCSEIINGYFALDTRAVIGQHIGVSSIKILDYQHIFELLDTFQLMECFTIDPPTYVPSGIFDYAVSPNFNKVSVRETMR